ncbi:MAG: hypothetical protein HYW78_01650 [Parcubacteria group bacterium]|nr:hypothetical protein [Parcubacteria group bacterium]
MLEPCPNKEIRETKKIKPEFLTLPDDVERVKKLKIKLKEYYKRLMPFKAPELQLDTICKITILSRLLKEKEIRTRALYHELRIMYGDECEKPFLNAIGVIDDYCKTGGATVQKGTGLK